jgi:vacuolar-type H+-ATPase subunit E/Vma4
MSHEIDDFLSALKENLNSEISKIHEEGNSKIAEIQETNQKLIAKLHEEHLSEMKSRSSFESFQRDLTAHHLDWIQRINKEKGHYIDQLFEELVIRVKAISNGPEINYLLNRLFTEVKNHIGNDFEVHITRNCDPNKFKDKTMITKKVIADLDQVGIVIKRLDIPITIENTLETRLNKIKDDIIILASQSLWHDVQISPWDTQAIMNKLVDQTFASK